MNYGGLPFAFGAYLIYTVLISYELLYILLTLFRTAPKDIHDDFILIDLVLRISVRQLLFKLTVLRCLLGIFRLFSSHGQFISITLTCLLVLSMAVASILLAFIWVVSANNGTSQKAVACSFSYSGLGVTCENHSSTLVMRSKDLRTSKKHEKHSSSLTFSSSHLFLISFPCHLSSDTVDYYHHYYYYYYYYYYYLIIIIVLFSVKYKYDPSVVEWHLPASK